jgi:hypothetical protein
VAFRFANFLGVLCFCAGCFADDFLPPFFVDLVDFFLDLLLIAIRAVEHRRERAANQGAWLGEGA